MSATNINRDPRMVSVSYSVHISKCSQDMMHTLLLKFAQLLNVYHDFPVQCDAVLRDSFWLVNISVPREWTKREDEWWGRFRKAMEKLAELPPQLN